MNILDPDSTFNQVLLAVAAVLLNVALSALAVFGIVLWTRSTIRLVQKRDWYTGIKESELYNTVASKIA